MKYNTKAAEEKMQKSVSAYENNLSTIRASQANGAIVSKVTFEYYGAQTKLTDMASVSVTDPKTLTITPYDRSTLKAMVKAIQASDIASFDAAFISGTSPKVLPIASIDGNTYDVNEPLLRNIMKWYDEVING